MHSCSVRLAALAILLTISTLPGRSCAAANDGSRSQTEVGRLIELLGSDSYATRVRAKEELQRMGLEAFDELHMAQFHPDNEIAMEARFLISSLLVSWSKESDPQEVRDALMEYGAQEESERSNRIDILAELPDRKGLEALVRLSRFETSLRLSRRAALAVMQQPMDGDPEIRQRSAKLVLEALGGNDRQASEWLRVYAEDLASGGYSTARWRELIAAQRYQIDTAATQQASRSSVLELVRVCATRAAHAGQLSEALHLANSNIDLIPPTSRHLIDACSWAIDNDLHPFVLELRRQHRRMFDQQPILLYGAAEAMKIAGDDAEADRLAQQASEIKPLPRSEQERAKMQPKLIEDTANAHRELGWKLKDRGLFHWAEREFRQIIDSMDIDSRPAAFARSDLAQMLGELERHDEVVEVLQPLTERMQNDGKLRQQLNAMLFNYSRVRSDVDYHTALSLIQKGKVEEAKPMLASAFRMYPPNIDILITMYRLDGDETWKAMVATTLQRTTRQLEAEVDNAQDQMRRLGPGGDFMLSQELNQYAWLVSNTEGDYHKALTYSLQSLELSVDGAKLDTCARCYYALDDIDNAIRMQKRALKLMPHSPPLQKQLAEFEAARAAKNSASNERKSGESDGADRP